MGSETLTATNEGNADDSASTSASVPADGEPTLIVSMVFLDGDRNARRYDNVHRPSTVQGVGTPTYTVVQYGLLIYSGKQKSNNGLCGPGRVPKFFARRGYKFMRPADLRS